MEEQDQKIKDFLKGSFDEAKPSMDFTQNVMAKIATEEVIEYKKVFQYEPVISKSGWMLIAGIFLSLVYLGLTGTKQSKLTQLNYLPKWNVEFDFSNLQLLLISMVSIAMLFLVDQQVKRRRLH